MKEQFRRYRFAVGMVVLLALLFVWSKQTGLRAVQITVFSVKEMLMVIPPVFLLLGLLDVWVPREMMIKYMGENSGIKGIILAIVIGSAAAGPLYGAFPVAAVFMKKGVKLSNILIFVGAWSTTKIPMLLFEISALGAKFALTRLGIDLIGIIVIAMLLSKLIRENEKQMLYEKAKNL